MRGEYLRKVANDLAARKDAGKPVKSETAQAYEYLWSEIEPLLVRGLRVKEIARDTGLSVWLISRVIVAKKGRGHGYE